MSNFKVRILSCKCSCIFYAGYLVHDRHKEVMKKIYDADEIVYFTENIACDHEFSAHEEWIIIACAGHITYGYED